jgi:hypothetical protein
MRLHKIYITAIEYDNYDYFFLIAIKKIQIIHFYFLNTLLQFYKI